VVHGLCRHGDLSARRILIEPCSAGSTGGCGPLWQWAGWLSFRHGVPVVLASSLPVVLASGLPNRVTGGSPVIRKRGETDTLRVAGKSDQRAGWFGRRDPQAVKGYSRSGGATPC
jgi:hypothetical protein